MNHPTEVSTPRHRRPSPSRWTGLAAAALTVASVTATSTLLAPNDVRVVQATDVALAARSTAVVTAAQPLPVSTLFDPAVTPVLASLSTGIYRQLLLSFQDPQQQEVIGDFFHGGIAGVLKKQATSRLQSPDQTQILNDFFQGGVYQSEAHRFLQLFTDPDQHQFISDLVTGGIVQVVRNRLLDATTDPAARQAIVDFFPDEVTDYRGGPIAVVQRQLIAAAKGNPVVIGLVNGIFENPVVVAVQHLLGGGPLIGTPLHELPPITPDAAVAPPHTVAVATKTVAPESVAAPTKKTSTPEPTPSVVERTAPEPAAEPKDRDTEVEKVVSADAMKAGNKVEPASAASAPKATPGVNDPESVGAVAEPTPAAATPAASADETKSSAQGGDE